MTPDFKEIPCILMAHPAIYHPPGEDIGKYVFEDHPDYVDPFVFVTLKVPADATDEEVQRLKEEAQKAQFKKWEESQ